jgi:retron-type reverse transcriptase
MGMELGCFLRLRIVCLVCRIVCYLGSHGQSIIGEALRMVLHSIYEPHFEHLNANFGFRPQCSLHNCLKNIQYKIQGKQFAIEGDVKAAYPSLDHQILMNLLRKRIIDRRFLQLIHRLLKAGIFDTLNRAISYDLVGVPQGQILSPILWNIYFQEFDIYVLHDLQSQIYQRNIFEGRKEAPKTRSFKNVTSKLDTSRTQSNKLHDKYTTP